MPYYRAHVDDYAQPDQRHTRPTRKTSSVNGKMSFTRAKLTKKQPEAAYREANPHQRQPSANPCKKSPLGCKVNPGVLFGRFIHSGIVITCNNLRSRTR